MTKQVQKVALLTAGGLAPCLSSSVGGLIERYSEIAPEIEIIGYIGGYKGLLKGESLKVTADVREKAPRLHRFGGSPIGNSRVKLTNQADCEKRGLVAPGVSPLKAAADQLTKDGITILHTIGGDDTNTTAADLAAYLKENNYDLTVVGLPKTIDNDVFPIKQSLGAWTAAEEGANYYAHVVAEHSANPRMLIIHEVMGRNCGWLTAATAEAYRTQLKSMDFLPEFNLPQSSRDVHAVFVPEMEFNLEKEVARLKAKMDETDNINIFVSEGACVGQIVEEMQSRGVEVPKDAFGHYKLDAVNVGQWFSKQFGAMLGAEKTLVQKSGYFSRAAPANAEDLRLIKSMVDLAVECGLRAESGVIGHDEDQQNRLRAIEFPRIAGGKPFDINASWFDEMLTEIGQEKGKKLDVAH